MKGNTTHSLAATLTKLRYVALKLVQTASDGNFNICAEDVYSSVYMASFPKSKTIIHANLNFIYFTTITYGYKQATK